MRPSPDEVGAWFAAALTQDALDGDLAVLHDDPNWLVRIASARPLCTLHLSYDPLGEWLTILLRHEGTLWRPQSEGTGASSRLVPHGLCAGRRPSHGRAAFARVRGRHGVQSQRPSFPPAVLLLLTRSSLTMAVAVQR